MAAAIGAGLPVSEGPVLWWLISVVVLLKLLLSPERRGLLLFRAHWW